jgi:hypothetical protein
MARLDGSGAAARRLRLAEAAIKGAHVAAGRGEQLRRLADRWARQAEVAALHQLLGHAGKVLADQASREEDIAYILTKLASKDGSDLAEERWHLADEALVGAQRARDRARALRRLAETGAAQVRAPRAPGRDRREPEMTARRGWRGPEERDREAEDRDEAASARDLAAETRIRSRPPATSPRAPEMRSRSFVTR